MAIDRTPAEVVAYIRDFMEDKGTSGAWDAFTSPHIKDPHLEAIRIEADAIYLPITREGRQKLRELLARAEALL